MKALVSLWRDERGGPAAEFALVLPLLILLLLGAIDGGRYLWEVNEAKKAVQAGVRWAVVTDPVEGGIITEDYVDRVIGGVTVTQGDIIPAAGLSETVCNDTQCQCIGNCVSSPSYNAAAFDSIVARMQRYYPQIQDSDVTVSYVGSGLGFAGDPNGADIAPLVTVSLSGLTFQPIATLQLANVAIPTASSSLTAEDLDGTDSN